MFLPLLNNIFNYPTSFFGYKIYRYNESSCPFDFKYIDDISRSTLENSELKVIEKNSEEISDRINLLGFDLNVDDLVILFVLFTMFRENNIDYSIIIALFIILFDQG